MKRSLFAMTVLVFALALCTSAWAGSVTYYSSPYWSAGQGGSSSFSSSWWQNIMGKNAGFDSTITFIDNSSYGWHSTVRGYGTYLTTHWFSSQVKKGHCRANVGSSAHATCSITS
jgi:hypothetical protein